jgi:hypothetical protein
MTIRKIPKKSPYTQFVTGIKLGKKNWYKKFPPSKILVEIVLPLVGCFLFSFFAMNLFICVFKNIKSE